MFEIITRNLDFFGLYYRKSTTSKNGVRIALSQLYHQFWPFHWFINFRYFHWFWFMISAKRLFCSEWFSKTSRTHLWTWHAEAEVGVRSYRIDLNKIYNWFCACGQREAFQFEWKFWCIPKLQHIGRFNRMILVQKGQKYLIFGYYNSVYLM